LSSAKISSPVASVKLKPDAYSEASSELLFGESVSVLDQTPDWCRITSVHDGYEGFIQSATLNFNAAATTHWVSNRATFVFTKPDIKAPVLDRLLFGSQLTANDSVIKENFLCLSGGGFVWAAHCMQTDSSLSTSRVDIAQSHYLNAPYRWGGRSTEGCDCSGLVQIVAMATGIRLPRDSGDQESALPVTIDFDKRRSEDLVFWPGHVGVLASADLLIHATAHSMRCCIEPLQQVIERAGSPSSVKRISA